MSALLDQFREDGFVLLRNFLDKEVVANIYREARQIFATQIKHVLGYDVNIGSKHWKLDAHQDWRTGQGSLDSAVIWFPMVNAGADLGALQVIPRSHKNGLMAASTSGYQGGITAELKDDDFVQTEFEVGDLLIFSAFLVHQSGNNITDNIRWSVQLRYNNLAEETFIERGYPMAYIYKPETELVTPDFPTPQQLETVFASPTAVV